MGDWCGCADTEREGGAESGAVGAEQTDYDLASLTKIAATTVSVMVLAGEGRIDVRKPVHNYLPEWRGEGKDAVTIWNLLTHTSGLPAGEWLYGSARSPAAAWRQVLGAKLVYPTGSKVVYSDFGFILLGGIVERISGMPLDEFAAEHVYVPLGMSSAQFLPPLVWRAEIAPTARLGERPYPLLGEVHDANAFRLGGVSGHAGLFASAANLAVLAQTMLNHGAYGPVRVFTPEVVDAFTRRQPRADTRALGWDTPANRSSAGEYFSAKSYGHTGFTGTSLWIDPEREIFVVLLTNRTYGRGSLADMLRVRAAVHDAVMRAITDQKIEPRVPAETQTEAEAEAEGKGEGEGEGVGRAKARRRLPPTPSPTNGDGGVRRGAGTTKSLRRVARKTLPPSSYPITAPTYLRCRAETSSASAGMPITSGRPMAKPAPAEPGGVAGQVAQADPRRLRPRRSHSLAVPPADMLCGARPTKRGETTKDLRAIAPEILRRDPAPQRALHLFALAQ